MSKIASLIVKATIRGAMVNTTRDVWGITTVQVIGLAGMSSWPLPASWAETELAAALGAKP